MDQIYLSVFQASNGMESLRIDHISDLHLDFWVNELNFQNPKAEKKLQNFIKMIKPNVGKVLILSGDQGHYFQQDKMLLLELKKYYENILIVSGNHDRYLVSANQQKKYRYDSENRILEMKRFCKETDGLYFMDGDVIVIDGFRIGGIGMWHDWSYGNTLGHTDSDLEDIWKDTMNDSNLIFQNGKENHNISYGYGIKKKIVNFKPFDLYKKYREKLDKMEPCHLIFSHYGPIIPTDMSKDYRESDATTFYYFDGKKDIDRLQPQFWIHGHTHKNYESVINNTKIITNPLGYPNENTYNTIKSIYLK